MGWGLALWQKAESAVQYTAVINCVHIRFKLLIVFNVMTEVFTMKMKVAGSFKTSVTIY